MKQRKSESVVQLFEEILQDQPQSVSKKESSQKHIRLVKETQSKLNPAPLSEEMEKGSQPFGMGEVQESLDKTVMDLVGEAKTSIISAEENPQEDHSGVFSNINDDVSLPSKEDLAIFDKQKKENSSKKKKPSLFKSRKKKSKTSVEKLSSVKGLGGKASKEFSNHPFVLTLSNNLKIAERKIKELEKDNLQFRMDSQKLAVSGEALQDNLNQLSSEYQTVKSNYEDDKVSWMDQKKLLEQALSAKSLEIKKLKVKNLTLEKHLERDIRRIRVKERELENKLELKKNEIESIIREKDKSLLSLKMELDSLKEKKYNQMEELRKLEEQMEDKKEKSHRAVRALQMSLHLLTDESSSDGGFGEEEQETDPSSDEGLSGEDKDSRFQDEGGLQKAS